MEIQDLATISIEGCASNAIINGAFLDPGETTTCVIPC